MRVGRPTLMIERFSGTECIFFRTLVELTKKWIGPSQCSCKNVSNIFQIIQSESYGLMSYICHCLSFQFCHQKFTMWWMRLENPVQLESSEFLLSLHV